MPKIDAGEGGKGNTYRESATLQLKAHHVADELIQGKEGKSDFVKLVFHSTKGEEFGYGVPIGQDAPRYLKPLTGAVSATSEEGIRRALAGVTSEPRWCKTWGSRVMDFLAGPGDYIAQLNGIRQAAGQDHKTWWISLITENGLLVPDFPARLPENLELRKGDEPENDYIGPKAAFNPDKSPWFYLVKLGLDWARFVKEMSESKALWPGHYDERLDPVESFFDDPADLTMAMIIAISRHGLKPVKVTVHVDPKYGLQVKKGQFFFELTEVIVQGQGPSAEFEREKGAFYLNLDALTAKVLNRPDARFMAGDKVTEDGRKMIGTDTTGIIKPLILAYPALVKLRRDDGTPGINIPPTPESWTLNGLAALNIAIERLMRLDDGEMFTTINMTNPAPLLAWAKTNCPELAGDMSDDQEEIF